MALTVGTDTYITLADATTYLATYGADGATVTESDLKKATVAIDRLYGSRFSGSVTSSTQALLYPRNAETTIPKVLTQATAELAAMINGGIDVYAAPDPILTEESVKVDVLQTTKKFAGGGYSIDPLRKITLILASILTGSSAFGSMSVVRA